ncbi:VirB4 family type IV secretion/conjugal transfer ATPase [Salmonella enterica]|uniref:VirB4 family type IV secretion/conjugal transfer ATPase n=1 Tax=Salmonella enterica TaxID=28901 RepID=UPI003BD5B3C6
MSVLVSPSIQKRKQIENDKVINDEIPYIGHVDNFTVTTDGRDYIQLIKVSGISFLSADDIEVNSWHRSLNNTLRSMAAAYPNVSFWTHIDRHVENSYPAGVSGNYFADQLDSVYGARMKKTKMRVNDLYLSIVYRPQNNVVMKKIFDLIMRNDEEGLAAEREKSITVINKISDEILVSLSKYDPERLGVYTHNGVNFSSTLEFYNYLVSGERCRIPLSRTPAKFIMSTSRPFFGSETIEMRAASEATLCAMIGIKEYPSDTTPGVFNELLGADYDFVLTQSFAFISKDTARRAFKLSRDRMSNADDDGKELINEIKDALNDLASNRFVVGQHHFSLMVKGKNQEDLLDNIAKSRPVLGDIGMVTVREDLALEASFWAQLPANFKYRPRVAAITSKNFAGFSPFHNYPSGRKEGNHWGKALTLMATAAGTPLYFSNHASDPLDKDGSTKKDVGHTLILGPNGSGKTVFVGFCIAMYQKFGATSIMFTKDNDSEILIRALGGKYYPIEMKKPTNWNPFHLPVNETNSAFLKDLCRHLGAKGRTLSDRDEKDIDYAVDRVLALPKSNRRIGRVLDYLDITKQESVYTALSRWCYASPTRPGQRDGENAWVFDNKHDELMENFGSVPTTGFDITRFLDIPELRTPICMYLFHLTEQLIDGRRLIIHLAEFWKLLDDEYFEQFAKDKLKTIRKQNGMVILDSQSPSDALNHPISPTLIEQTATKIIFPIPGARRSEFTDPDRGLGLSEREYELISEELREGSRMFLVKQGHGSVVAKLDLKGMDNELAVISARTSNVRIVNELIAKYGNKPELWLPEFYKLKRAE